MQTSVNANKSQEIQLGGGESESGLIPKLHRSNWEENLAWNSHSICNLATVPRHGRLGVDGRMFSLTCSWLRVSLPNVLLRLKPVNSVGSRTLLPGLVEKWRVEETIYLQWNWVCLCPASNLSGEAPGRPGWFSQQHRCRDTNAGCYTAVRLSLLTRSLQQVW